VLGYFVFSFGYAADALGIAKVWQFKGFALVHNVRILDYEHISEGLLFEITA